MVVRPVPLYNTTVPWLFISPIEITCDPENVTTPVLALPIDNVAPVAAVKTESAAKDRVIVGPCR